MNVNDVSMMKLLLLHGLANGTHRAQTYFSMGKNAGVLPTLAENGCGALLFTWEVRAHHPRFHSLQRGPRSDGMTCRPVGRLVVHQKRRMEGWPQG